MSNNLAVVDMGGGERGVFGAGVFDRCLEDGIEFGGCYGVSAGSANVVTYIAKQIGRTKRFYLDYAFRKKYMSLANFIKHKSYVDLDYVYSTLSNSNGEDPLDYSEIAKTDKHLVVVATDAITAEPTYFTNDDMSLDSYDIMKASSSLPVIGPPYPVYGKEYFDGGLSDPLPIQKAFDDGFEKVLLIMTRPKDFRRSPKSDRITSFLLKRKYPLVSKALHERAKTYNDQLEWAISLEKEDKVVIVAPTSIEGIKTLTKDREKLEGLYNEGYKAAHNISERLF